MPGSRHIIDDLKMENSFSLDENSPKRYLFRMYNLFGTIDLLADNKPCVASKTHFDNLMLNNIHEIRTVKFEYVSNLK